MVASSAVASSALLALGLASAGAREVGTNGSCPLPALAEPVRFSRPHQIATVAPRDDVSHKVVTPGGMVLDTPKWVAATDVLTLFARDQEVMCFDLLTFARERNRCQFAGVARSTSDGAYAFRENSAVVRFTFTSETEVSIEAVGEGYRSRCEPSGKIERAIYTRIAARSPH